MTPQRNIIAFNASGRIAYAHNEIMVFIESNAIHGYAQQVYAIRLYASRHCIQ
jgi:hypothetical protein